MNKAPILLCLVLIPILSNGQSYTDAQSGIPYPGFYLTYEDFVHNRVITPKMILIDNNLRGSDFYDVVRNAVEVEYLENDTVKSFKNLWAYSDGKAFYLNRFLFSGYNDVVTNDNSFIRVGVFGNISLVVL